MCITILKRRSCLCRMCWKSRPTKSGSLPQVNSVISKIILTKRFTKCVKRFKNVWWQKLQCGHELGLGPVSAPTNFPIKLCKLTFQLFASFSYRTIYLHEGWHKFQFFQFLKIFLVPKAIKTEDWGMRTQKVWSCPHSSILDLQSSFRIYGPHSSILNPKSSILGP